MIKINEEALSKANAWSDDTIHILADFDRTLTVGTSETSWGILSKTTLLPPDYAKRRQENYEHYRPIEIDETMDFQEKNKLMIEWWNKHISMFVEYKLSEQIVHDACSGTNIMQFRCGVKEMLENMHERGIPVIIISAGIGNFIEQFLINNSCNYDNIYIVSNFIKFKNGIAVGLSDSVIHSLNKNEAAIPDYVKEVIKNRPNIILLGDQIPDVKMAREEDRANALKIGFLNEQIEENLPYFESVYDVVCTGDTNYFELTKKVRVLYKK